MIDWQYSRSQLRHEAVTVLEEIEVTFLITPTNKTISLIYSERKKSGYDLHKYEDDFFKQKLLHHAATVKELKDLVEKLTDEKGKGNA